MESERLRIILDNPDRIYYGGDTICGVIWMNVTKRTKIRAIKIQVTGKGKCKWIEILRKESTTDTRHLFYTGKEIYEHSETPLPDFGTRGIEIPPGEPVTFNFAIKLGATVPSSFKGSHGSIKYKMRVLIQRPWTFDQRHIIPFTVVRNSPVPRYRLGANNALEKQITKTISLFGTRPITMLALLPEDFAVRGEPLRVCVTVTNNSTTNVEKLRFTVLQNITYYSQEPLRIAKRECVAIASKETGAVHKKSERSFAHELLIPETAQPSDDSLSGVINILYELRIEAVLRGFFKNLVLNLHFTVYSQDPAIRNASRTQPPPPRPVGPPDYEASFESNISSAGPEQQVYPTLDSSIGSPSHSSQYSECSSINSITSDTSAATLSPAMGALDLSYTSDSQSSIFAVATTDTSLRSSNVPYLPYSSSPMMQMSSQGVLELTSPIPNVPLPPQTSPVPQSSGYNQLPSTSASASVSTSTGILSFLQPRQPPGAHEQPPSYEELFGGASAPPESPK